MRADVSWRPGWFHFVIWDLGCCGLHLLLWGFGVRLSRVVCSFLSPQGSCSAVHCALLLPPIQAIQLDLGSADCVIVVGFGLSYLGQAGLWALGALWLFAGIFGPRLGGLLVPCPPVGLPLDEGCILCAPLLVPPWVLYVGLYLVCAPGLSVLWEFTGCSGSLLRPPAMPYVQEHT